MIQPVLLYLVLAWGQSASVLVAGAVAIAAVYAFGAITNDLVDRERDAEAGKRRPLITGELGVGTARRLLFGAVGAVGVAQLWLEQPLSAFVSAAGILLGMGYSRSPVALQLRGWLGPSALVVSYVGGPVFFALAHGAEVSVVSVGAMALLGGAVVVHKDIPDLDSDRLTNKQTPAVVWGPDVVRWLSVMLAVASFALIVASGGWVVILFAGLTALLLVLNALRTIDITIGRATGLIAILAIAAGL